MKSSQNHQRNFSLSLGVCLVGLVTFYLATHLLRLNSFPVFADESIYIRWAQLLLDDPKQYLFFALNDGKTPLFIWMLAAAQSWSSDQLVAGRLISVLGGFVQLFAVFLILRQFTARKSTQLLGMLLVCVLPFWFTYHRFAVMDGWLTAWLSLSFWASLKIVKTQGTSRWMWVGLSGLTYGLALWTKIPALFYLPIFVVVPFFAQKLGQKTSPQLLPLKPAGLFKSLMPFVLAGGLGLLIFGLMRLNPGFGQLFSRGQDFSYTIPEILSGRWIESFSNISRYVGFFGTYLTWPVLVLVAAGLFSKSERRTVGLLLLSALIFLSPFIVLGKVVYPRYLLPAALFLTVAAVLSLEALCLRCSEAVRKGKLAWAGIALLIALFAGQAFTQAAYFMTSFVFTPDNTPFVAVDRVQYLEEWSSGHGIRETVHLISELTRSHSVAVATEGRFGTLPDGLLLYFHGRDVSNLYVEGTGQYPVKNIPDFFSERAKGFDQSLLVVNSHRMELKLPQEKLLAEFCRPNQAPCLQVWDVTDLVKAAPDSQSP